MKFSDSGTMSKEDKVNHVKAVLSKNQPKDEPDADDLEPSGTIERMSIEPAGNGYTVETHHKPGKGKGKDGPEYTPPAKHVFTSHEDMANHVRQAFGKGKK